jgi:hypothetical protein
LAFGDTSSLSSVAITTMSFFKIDTFESKPQQTHTIDISSSTGLAALKKNDAFMYYSIPSAREAEGFKQT